LFNRNQGAIVRAGHEYVAARQALAQLNLDLRNRLAPVFEQYQNAKNQIDRYRKTILPTAEESLVLTRKMYRAGETGYITLLTAQRTFAHTQLNYLGAITLLRVKEAEINGLLLRGALQSDNVAGNGALTPYDSSSQSQREITLPGE